MLRVRAYRAGVAKTPRGLPDIIAAVKNNGITAANREARADNAAVMSRATGTGTLHGRCCFARIYDAGKIRGKLSSRRFPRASARVSSLIEREESGRERRRLSNTGNAGCSFIFVERVDEIDPTTHELLINLPR